jgi:hypothetical protein
MGTVRGFRIFGKSGAGAVKVQQMAVSAGCTRIAAGTAALQSGD